MPRHHRSSSFALVAAALACVMLAPSVAAAQWGPWGPYYPYPYGRYQAESSLRIDVKPKDAEVFVDGYYAGIVDDFDGTFQRLHVIAGQHRLAIYLAGFHTIERDLYLEPNETTKIHESMQPLAQGEPNDPRPTPMMPPGGAAQPPPQRQPRAPGRRMPPPPQPPAPPPPNVPAPVTEASLGTLVIRVQPDGTELTIDDQRWSAPAGDEQLLVQLSEGAHRIEVRKSGYVSYAAQIDIHRGETVPLNVNLAPK